MSASVRRQRALPRDREVAYRHSPHLAQWALRDRLVGLLEDVLADARAAGLPPRLVEVAAGHGGYAAEALAAGFAVTAVDLSERSAGRLAARFAGNDRLTCLADPSAGLDRVAAGQSVALAVSVLHHIPDYLAFLDRLVGLLCPGGSLLTVQDPLYYPRLDRLTRVADRGAYLAWRLGQGEVRAGLAAMNRRRRGVYPQGRPGEIVYYHVVRDGVDEEAVTARLSERFADVTVVSYWSNHLGAARRPAELARLANTFAVRASGLR